MSAVAIPLVLEEMSPSEMRALLVDVFLLRSMAHLNYLPRPEWERKLKLERSIDARLGIR